MKQAGMTLVELLVALALFALIVLFGWQLIGQMNKSSQVATEVEAAHSRLFDAYRGLDQDTQFTAARPLSLSSKAYQVTDSNLKLERLSFNQAGSETVEYRVSDQQLIRSQAGNQYVLLDNIEQARFELTPPSRFSRNREQNMLLLKFSFVQNQKSFEWFFNLPNYNLEPAAT